MSHDYTTTSSPFLLIILSVQMVSHLILEDGAVLRHVEHGDLIANGLIFCLRCKDPLSDSSHVVIGLCRGRKCALCSAERNVSWLHPVMQR